MNPMRFTLEEARDALLMAVEQNHYGRLMTGMEEHQCTQAFESIDKCLIEDGEAEAAAQRARDKCIGAYGYDMDRLK